MKICDRLTIFSFILFIIFNGVIVNCQLKRISTTNSITIDNFQQQNFLFYPIASNSTYCNYDLSFLATDNNNNNNNILTVNKQGILQVLYTTNTSTSSILVFRIIGSIILGSNISTISAISGIIQADYELNLTCTKVDVSQLTLTINEFIKFDSNIGYYSSIRVLGIDYIFNTLDNLNSSIISSNGRSNNYVFVWFDLKFENEINSIFTISVVISGVIINLTTKSFYYNVPLPTTQYYDIIPQHVNGSEILEFGFHYSPLIIITCDSQTPRPYQLLSSNSTRYFTKPMMGRKGKLIFITSFKSIYGFNNFELISLQQDGISKISIPMNIKDFPLGSFGGIVYSILKTYGTGSTDMPQLIPLFEQHFRNNNTYVFTSNLYQLGQIYKFDAGWPFGFIDGNNLIYNHNSVFSRPLNYTSSHITYIFGTSLTLGNTPYESYQSSIITTISSQRTNPILTSYSYKRLKGKNSNILFTANIVSINGVQNILINNYVIYGLDTLVSGSNKNGTYEIVFNLAYYGFFDFSCQDVFGNSFYYTNNQIISYNPLLIFKVPDYFTNSFNVDSFDNIKFFKNNLNLLNSVGYNTMHLNSSTIDPDTPLSLILLDPVSMSYQSIGGSILYGSFPIVYDSTLKLFTCDFIVPRNNLFGEVPYYIMFTNGIIISNQLSPNSPKLIVDDTYLDNQGPIFKMFTPLNSGVKVNDINQYGYTFNITDDFNGFSSGSITVRGSIDSSKYVFNFSLADALYGDKINSQYQITLPISKQCVSQTYLVTNAILLDSNNVSSIFNLYSNNPDPTTNPFINLYDKGIQSLYLNIVCEPISLVDQGPQNLVSFKHSIINSIIDVGKTNRSITFDFSINSPPSGIKDQQSPIVYIISTKFEKFECVSQLTGVDTVYGTSNFTCTESLPVGFGYPGPLIFSVYGFINNAGYYFGHSTITIAKLFPSSYYVDTTLSTSEPIITSTDSIYSTGGSLLIYGRALSTTKQVLVYYSETGSESTLIQNTTYGSSAVLINPIAETKKPFKIQIITNSGLKSNEYWVNPIYFESPIPPTIPTNPPQKCLGNPECGGKSQGYCSPNGCICYPPWIGTSCQSKVILVPPPIVNPSEPSTNLTTNSTNNEVSSLVGVISIVSLRELDINNQVIKTNRFEKWNQTNLEKNRNIYTTSIKFSNNINDCIVNVETEWYEKLTNISFANQVLVMNPSTLKYNINITSYPFENKLNTLQLVIKAKLTQNNYDDDVCSGQDFGNTVADNSEYVQLSVKDHSLYGRFVKRAIVDGRLLSINNIKLDDLDDESNYYTSESYIGIQIPQYTNLVQLDPDFGLLVDSSSTDSICRDSSSLSRAAKIGIIVGCVGFVIVVVIVVALLVKYKYHLRNLKSEIKMKRKQ
ncbi:hypothetical protein RB653_006775 [Dictyostelium firmibasis]|uniref:EGF-like domain-containing protein n=1 Tax=Dictyostelium firmibasis TaxID=79012 RepID=A0AAN7TKR8_9MYCE